jgi:hypothetical protein
MVWRLRGGSFHVRARCLAAFPHEIFVGSTRDAPVVHTFEDPPRGAACLAHEPIGHAHEPRRDFVSDYDLIGQIMTKWARLKHILVLTWRYQNLGRLRRALHGTSVETDSASWRRRDDEL